MTTLSFGPTTRAEHPIVGFWFQAECTSFTLCGEGIQTGLIGKVPGNVGLWRLSDGRIFAVSVKDDLGDWLASFFGNRRITEAIRKVAESPPLAGVDTMSDDDPEPPLCPPSPTRRFAEYKAHDGPSSVRQERDCALEHEREVYATFWRFPRWSLGSIDEGGEPPH